MPVFAHFSSIAEALPPIKAVACYHSHSYPTSAAAQALISCICLAPLQLAYDENCGPKEQLTLLSNGLKTTGSSQHTLSLLTNNFAVSRWQGRRLLA